MNGLLMLLAACSDANMSAAEDRGSSVEDGAGYLELESLDLRVDVVPTTGNLPPQTWAPAEGASWSNLTINLDAPQTLTGLVEAHVPTTGLITVPGEPGPVDGLVSIYNPDGLEGDASATNPDNGRFTLVVPPGVDYLMTVLPDDSGLPFRVARRTVVDDAQIDFDLNDSVPVYGQVRDATGEPVVGAQLQLVHATTGIRGPITETDDQGAYVLRATPEVEYNLELVPREGSLTLLPVVTDWKIIAEADGLLRRDVSVGDLSTTFYRNRVVDQDGVPVADVVVRFTSSALFFAEGSSEVATTTNQHGLVRQDLLPGRYEVEYIPPSDSGLSPVLLEEDVGSDYIAAAEVVLPSFVEVRPTLVDPASVVVEYVSVVFTERGFDGRQYGGATDENGELSIRVPTVPLLVTLTPPSGGDLAITHYEFTDPADIPAQLSLRVGSLFSGVVRDDAGDPLPEAALELRVAGESSPFATGYTDGDGRFDLRSDVTSGKGE